MQNSQLISDVRKALLSQGLAKANRLQDTKMEDLGAVVEAELAASTNIQECAVLYTALRILATRALFSEEEASKAIDIRAIKGGMERSIYSDNSYVVYKEYKALTGIIDEALTLNFY